MDKRRVPLNTWSALLTAIVLGRYGEQVSRDFGIHRKTVVRWTTLAGMELARNRVGGLRPIDLSDPPASPERAYRRLTLSDRTFIETALAAPHSWSLRQIASHLRIHVSTVSREVRKHQVRRSVATQNRVPGSMSSYHATLAHYRTVATRRTPRMKKLDDPFLRDQVVSGLNAKLSPQQVAGRLRVQFPNSPEVWVSHETIYQALYVQGKGALRHELTVEKALRSGRTSRHPKSRLPERRGSRPWLKDSLLSDRPAEVRDRAVPGHWEGDLVVGPGNSALVTLVERSTRFALIGRLPGSREALTVNEFLQHLIIDLPEELRKTITWDQGVELAKHAEFTVATGCRVFFCDPHSPWQRGSNENLNGLIRDFYPKGSNFNRVTDKDIAHMQDLLNDRPRKTLGFYTPREKLNELISVALTA